MLDRVSFPDTVAGRLLSGQLTQLEGRPSPTPDAASDSDEYASHLLDTKAGKEASGCRVDGVQNSAADRARHENAVGVPDNA